MKIRTILSCPNQQQQKQKKTTFDYYNLGVMQGLVLVTVELRALAFVFQCPINSKKEKRLRKTVKLTIPFQFYTVNMQSFSPLYKSWLKCLIKKKVHAVFLRIIYFNWKALVRVLFFCPIYFQEVLYRVRICQNRYTAILSVTPRQLASCKASMMSLQCHHVLPF